MSDPAAQLQKGIFSALTSSGPLAALIGDRVYDDVPPKSAFPYVTISDAQVLDDGDTCESEQFEVFADLHIWSRTVGLMQSKNISGYVRDALLNIDAVPEWLVPVVEFRGTRHGYDPDGVTAHSIATFRFLLQPA